MELLSRATDMFYFLVRDQQAIIVTHRVSSCSRYCYFVRNSSVLLLFFQRVDKNVLLWDNLQEQITTAAEERVLSHKSLQNDISWNANSLLVIL